MKIYFDFSKINEEIAEHINKNAEIIAEKVAGDAKSEVTSRRFSRGSNSVLAKRIKAKKSKFEGGGWIVLSTAPHSWLNEFGGHSPRIPTEKEFLKFEIDGEIIFSKKVAKMPAKPFLRPALENNINDAKKQFGAE